MVADLSGVDAGKRLRRTYAVGDIHGRLDLLDAAIEAIKHHARGCSFRVVFLGDYVDRGPESRGVVERLIELQKIWPVVCLKGNHEDLMLRALVEPSRAARSSWHENGGGETLRSYGVGPEDEAMGLIPGEHLRWLLSLPLTTGDPHRIDVHAGLMPKLATHRQKEQTCLWIREAFLRGRPGDFEAHVVHGHTPLWSGKPDPAQPELLAHRTNLDTGAFATGVLSTGVFDDDAPGGPMEVIRICGRPMPHLALDQQEEPPAPLPGGDSALKRLVRHFQGRGDRARWPGAGPS